MVKLFVDLDNTILSSGEVYDKYADVSAKYGVPHAELFAARDLAIKTYGLGRMAEEELYEILVKKYPGIPQSIINEWQDLWISDVRFPDVPEFLLRSARHDLIIVTAGKPEKQLRKITTQGLAKHCKEIHVVGSPKCNHIVPGPMPVAYLDDAPREIEAMRRMYPHVFCIQVRQPPSWEAQKTTEYKDAHAEDLVKALEIIEARYPFPLGA